MKNNGARATSELPFSPKQLTRLLWALVILLAFTAGYFHARLKTQQRYNEVLKQQVINLKAAQSEQK